MASAYIGGKVLVVIHDHKSRCPYIRCYPQAAHEEDRERALSALYEDVPLHIGLDVKSVLSNRQMAMPEGTTFRLALTVVLSYHSDYWGEWDSDLEVVKKRTLREQLPNSKLRRKWKLFDKQEAKKQKAIKGSKT